MSKKHTLDARDDLAEMAEVVTHWLNGDERDAGESRQRVLEILDTIGKLDDAVQDREWKPTLGQILSGALPHDSDVFRLTNSLDRLLSSYRSVPVVEHSAGKRWFFRESAVDGCVDPDEHLVVRTIIDLENVKKLSCIRKCNCGTWFFAWREDRNFCSTACRRHNYETTDEYRTSRREYMRNRYHDEKERDERNKARNRKAK